MILHSHRPIGHDSGSYLVPGPRLTDGVGETLRNAFRMPALPADMQAALRKLDTVRPV